MDALPSTAFALVSSKGQHLGGALYQTRDEAERSLCDLAGTTTYDGIVELAVVTRLPATPSDLGVKP